MTANDPNADRTDESAPDRPPEFDTTMSNEDRLRVTEIMNEPSRLTETADFLEEIVLDANVTPDEVADMTRTTITLKRTLDLDEAELKNPLNDEYTAGNTVFTRAIETETLTDTEGYIVFADRRVCSDCEVAFTLDEDQTTLDECPNCGGEVDVASLPRVMEIEQTYEFDEQVNTTETLERVLEETFDVAVSLPK